jgi:hypothetical protein
MSSKVRWPRLHLSPSSQVSLNSSARRQNDQARLRRLAAVKEEVEKLEAEMKGHDCDAMVKEHLRALNEVRLSGGCRKSTTRRLILTRASLSPQTTLQYNARKVCKAASTRSLS